MLCLAVGPENIFPDNANEQKLYTSEKKERDLHQGLDSVWEKQSIRHFFRIRTIFKQLACIPDTLPDGMLVTEESANFPR